MWNSIDVSLSFYQARDGMMGASGLMNDLNASDKMVHADFYNNFGDLFDDSDLS